MDMIVCHNLTKRFGDLVAVDNLSLCVGAGELFGFLGPNGAGKTTTIKMITGLLKPTSGTAIVGGYDIQQHTLQAKSILGYIPDNPFLYEKLTGREYLHFMADLYSVGHKDRARRIEDLLRLFELEEKGNDLIQGYSRGMRQKISLAGALLHEPKVIFLDEPTVGLDPKSARTMKDILRELCRRGTTVFVSTHILEIAEQMCDRVAIVNKGRLVASGTMEELRAAVAANASGAHRNGDTSGPDNTDKKSLEDIFLELTGGAEYANLIQYLG
ncbi:MAG TPA: ABC transporter ATP-binding protein [Chthonomonadaceae bacterium]|nr:ABC transporter ATP-binding protein [Chthonomonadaceae bacterium]